jgi:flagellar biosynthetic protein FliO
MEIILPVLLALCLGVIPVFSQDVSASDAAVVAGAEEAAAAQVETEFQEVPALPEKPVVSAAVEKEAASFESLGSMGSDVPQLSFLRAFGGLGLVLCLLVGAYLGVRKFAPGYFPKMTSEGKNLKIVESIGMGDRRSIALVEVGGRRFLLGSTPQQINMLTALPEHFSMVAEENVVPVASVAKEEVGEKRPFMNLFDMGKKRHARHSGHVLPDEIRMKMRRLREALENR